MKRGAHRRLSRRVREFREHPENRGTRCIKRAPMRRVRKTLKHITHAVHHAYVHEDANVRTKAKELVRSLQCQSFEETEERARNFNGLLREVGRRRNEQQRKRARRRIEIGNLNLVQLNSVEQLKRVGRKLSLCVAHRDDLGREYHARLRSEESEFYRVERNGTAIGLIEIDQETRRVLETAGRRNKTLKLKRKVACEMLRVLEAQANNIDTFTRVGAFNFVLDSSPNDVTPLQVDGYDYRFWFDPDGKRIAIQKRRAVDAIGKHEGSAKWSLFERGDQERRMRRRLRRRRRSENRSEEWCEVCWHRGAMAAGELVDLLIRSPELAESIREAFYGQTGPVEASGIDFSTWNPADFVAAVLAAPPELGEVAESIPALGDGTESWTRRLASP